MVVVVVEQDMFAQTPTQVDSTPRVKVDAELGTW